MKNSILWTVAQAGPDDIDLAVANNDGLPRYFRVQTDPALNSKRDLMKIALTDDRVKRLLLKLTNLGYSLYYHADGESRFIRHDRLRHHWPAVKSGAIKVSREGIFYTVEEPPSGHIEKLVVVFSPVSSRARLIRYFRPSFGTLQKYLAPHTAVLRVADMGGVKGAFYLDTTALPANSLNTHRLIDEVATRSGLLRSDVVIYGASKGGTGALYHGLAGGWRYVAVDPILSDEWYEMYKNDYHFTSGGVFARPKQDVFFELSTEISRDCNGPDLSSVLITSSRSPQYPYTLEVMEPLLDRIAIFDSQNVDINKHPDVAPKTIYAQVMAINSLLLGMEVPVGVRNIP